MIDLIKQHRILIVKVILVAGYTISIPGLWMMRYNPQTFELSWIFTTISLLLLLLFHKPFTKKFAIAILAVGIIGWLVEAIGTNTGLIFGEYNYGPSLGPKVFATPLSMMVNWMISVYLIVMILAPKINNKWRLAFAGASLMVLYDILLEPVAISLNMWSWESGTPPFQNYIAWFVVSFPLVMLLGKQVKHSDNPLVIIVFVCQVVFFFALNMLIALGGL